MRHHGRRHRIHPRRGLFIEFVPNLADAVSDAAP